MADNKTKPTKVKVSKFIAAIDHERRREDAGVLCEMMGRATGFEPQMWGDSIVNTIADGIYHLVFGHEADRLVNEDGDLFVFRPLAHVAEADCARFATAMGYPIIPCDLCGSQDGLQRQQVKKILDGWEANHPGRRNKMFRASVAGGPPSARTTAA